MTVAAQPSISTIILNLSDTVVAGIPGVESRLSSRHGIAPETVIPAFCHPSVEEACLGMLPEAAYLEKVIESGKWSISPDELRQELFENFRSVVEGMPELLEELSQRGFSLILESNHLREWINQIETIHPFLVEVFEQRVFSFETGQLNKTPAAFAAIAARIERPPAECLYIGNSSTSCEAAEAAGMQVILFHNASELRKCLAELNLI